MSDVNDPGAEAPDEGELLAAYLDAQTDELTSARIERRLASEPALAARLDAIAAATGRLQRLSSVELPPQVRDRLRARLAEERAGVGDHPPASAADKTTSPDDDAVAAVTPRRRWQARFVPLAAAAVIVLLAVLGVAGLLAQTGGGLAASGGNEESGAGRGAADTAAGEAQQEAPAAAPRTATERSGGRGGAAVAGASAAPDRPSSPRPPAKVDGDDEILARAGRLLNDPPSSLRAREQRLRRGAGLATDRLCVTDLDAATVDLIDEDGRVALAVLLAGRADQIVLLDPGTCAPMRMVPRQP